MPLSRSDLFKYWDHVGVLDIGFMLHLAICAAFSLDRLNFPKACEVALNFRGLLASRTHMNTFSRSLLLLRLFGNGTESMVNDPWIHQNFPLFPYVNTRPIVPASYRCIDKQALLI